ncbi:unnamed protein product [Caenorhabditis bovis]|uniref:NTF2-like domain-containing protein n=1 Tax=Caenorhabditis bovis TaxID=2654633 RepID=A0A8S1EV19_9PELO|nr:unnamed protein product [Caenorhabditis bovis]
MLIMNWLVLTKSNYDDYKDLKDHQGNEKNRNEKKLFSGKTINKFFGGAKLSSYISAIPSSYPHSNSGIDTVMLMEDVAGWVRAQSSEENEGAIQAAVNLLALVHDMKQFSAEVCGQKFFKFVEFADFLRLQRTKYKASSTPPEINLLTQNNETKAFSFKVSINSTCKMGYNVLDEYTFFIGKYSAIFSIYHIDRMIFGGGCAETGSVNPDHIFPNKTTRIISEFGSGQEFGQDVAKRIPFPPPSEGYPSNVYQTHFASANQFKSKICTAPGMEFSLAQFEAYSSFFYARWKIPTREMGKGAGSTYYELVDTPDLYVFRHNIPLMYLNRYIMFWDFIVRCEYNINGDGKWKITAVDIGCPKQHIAGKGIEETYGHGIVEQANKAITALVESRNSEDWECRFNFNKLFEFNEKPMKLKICDTESQDVKKTMWELFTSYDAQSHRVTTSIISYAPYLKFTIKTELIVCGVTGNESSWNFRAKYDPIMTIYNFEELEIACPIVISYGPLIVTNSTRF